MAMEDKKMRQGDLSGKPTNWSGYSEDGKGVARQTETLGKGDNDNPAKRMKGVETNTSDRATSKEGNPAYRSGGRGRY